MNGPRKTAENPRRENNLILWGILSFSVVLKSLLYSPHPPFWDGAVYILMGKYFWSAGHQGLLEPYRPFLWPWILGFLNGLNVDPVFAGTLINFLAHTGSIYFVYRIGLIIGSKTEAIVAAILLCLSPIFLFWGNTVYPDVTAAFLSLAMVYFWLQRREFQAGSIGAAAFFLKFILIIPIIVLGVFSVFQRSMALSRKVRFLSGVLLVGLMLLVVQGVLYQDMFAFYKHGKLVYGQLEFSWLKELIFCLRRIVQIESGFLILVPWGLFCLLRPRGAQIAPWAVGAVGICSFLWVPQLAIPEHVPRYFILSLPFLYLISAVGWNDLKQSTGKNRFSRGILVIVSIGVLVPTFLHVPLMRHIPRTVSPVQKYVITHEAQIKGRLWLSDPRSIVYSALKADELMYYPVFDANKADDLRAKLGEPDIIFWDSRALVCRPHKDAHCEMAKRELFEEILRDFQADYIEKTPDGVIMAGIFRRITDDGTSPTRRVSPNK